MVKAVGSKVIIKIKGDEEVSKGGIYTPKNIYNDKGNAKGIVVSIGDKVNNDDIKINSIVYFNKFQCKTFIENNETYYVCGVYDIMAVIEE